MRGHMVCMRLPLDCFAYLACWLIGLSLATVQVNLQGTYLCTWCNGGTLSAHFPQSCIVSNLHTLTVVHDRSGGGDFLPILEVSVTFLAIFITMIPVLQVWVILEKGEGEGEGEGGAACLTTFTGDYGQQPTAVMDEIPHSVLYRHVFICNVRDKLYVSPTYY